MELVMGPLPGADRKVPLDPAVLDVADLPKVTRKKVTYASEKDHRVPAYLLIPKGLNGRAPAMLCLHGSSGAKGRIAGLGEDYARYALELAERGYVTIAPDYPMFGENQVDPYALGYASGTMKGIWDHVRAVDLLQSLPEADPERIGCVGVSLGGHNSLFVAAFDARLKAVVTSVGFDSFADYMGGNLTGWCQRCYMPRIAGVYGKDPKRLPFDFPEVLAAIAPRPVFVHAPLGDSNFRVESVKRCVEAARGVYRLFDAEADLVAVHPEGGHGFPPAAREQAYAFLDRVLKPAAAPQAAKPATVKERRLGNITLVYSAESEGRAEDLLAYAARCHERLAQWFHPPAPIGQKVHWLGRRDWRGKPDSYGFPYASGVDAYLAAADLDLPTQLALIADAMDIERGGPEVDRMARLLGLPDGSPPADVRNRLKESKEFFVTLTAYFIMPHELTHGYCNTLHYPSTPRWFYEGLAQWAAYQMQCEFRSPQQAELIYEYYQLLWTRGGPSIKVTDFVEADRLGAGKLTTPNYAWYHAGLLRMFRDLDAMKGGGLASDLVRHVGQRFSGQRAVSNQEMIAAISEVVGRDVKAWFAQTWRIE
jgi:dienelactone hydrolase